MDSRWIVLSSCRPSRRRRVGEDLFASSSSAVKSNINVAVYYLLKLNSQPIKIAQMKGERAGWMTESEWGGSIKLQKAAAAADCLFSFLAKNNNK